MATNSKAAKKSEITTSLAWFQIPADDVSRAKEFYSGLFDWKVNRFPNSPPGEHEYIDTRGADTSPDGGLIKRTDAEHTITIYSNVPSVAKFLTKVEKLGGSIREPKTAIPGRGYLATCKDTEDDTFAVWERNSKAK